jgi:RNA polymerase sigma factor (sigma-70 family)
MSRNEAPESLEQASMEIEKQVEAQSVNDEIVIERVKNGEKRAYELIMRKYNKRLFRIARAYIANEDEIEDIVQESYIKAYEQLERFENRSAFSTWLIRIVINEALARLKRGKRFIPIADDRPDEFRELPMELRNNDTPMEKLMNTELKDILEKAVDRLPVKYRSVFLMREIEDMSVAETSEALEITESNVKVRLNRAKEMLRETIGEFYHNEDVFQFNLVRCDRIVQNVLHRIGIS